MKNLSLFILLGLSALFYSCEDHTGLPAENGQKVRLTRLYISTDTIPDHPTKRYFDFFYDESGRLNSVPYFMIDNNGTPVLSQHTILYYDQQGRVEHERTDGLEARSVLYGYNAQNKIENIWITTDGIPGNTGYRLKYDQEGKIKERLFYVVNGMGDSTSFSKETYTYDNKNNITGLHQVKIIDGNVTLEKTQTYQYDDKPNPWYNLPPLYFTSQAYLHSPNNITELSSEENSLPPTGNPSYSYSRQFNNKYSNGLLEETKTVERDAWKFVYEHY